MKYYNIFSGVSKVGCSAVLFLGTQIYKARVIVKWLLLAYLVTKLSSPMYLHLLFTKFWL